MRATRRTLLQLPLLSIAVSGCATSPVVTGQPGDAAEFELPTRSTEAAAVAAWVARFAALVDGVVADATVWGADETQRAWIAALQSQCAAQVARVVAVDPVAGGPTAFPTPNAADIATMPTTQEAAFALLAAEASTGAPILRSGLVAAASGQDRLFNASLAVAVSASLAPALPPDQGGAGPSPFTEEDKDTALSVALGHARALIAGLELGLGRLASSDELRTAGTQRLDSAREVRNKLIAALPDELPEVDVWELPTVMSADNEILAGWALLEGNLLNAFGSLAASDSSGASDWLDSMLTQVSWIHRWGGRLPYWPGWVTTT